ncbi:MAG: type II secretion system protein F [marine bacterium B5-7]|nr:MAG: type II secretion system protein F [marine bacterium B5-7]
MATNPKKNLQTFLWTGLDSRKRKVNGEQDAPNAAFLKSLLRRQGITDARVRKKPKASTFFSKRITGKSIALVTRQIATLISAGIPIAQSIAAVSRSSENPRLGEVLSNIRRDVEGGTAFSVAIRKYPAYFDRLYVNLVAVGEESGTLDHLMLKIASYLERVEEIKGKIRSAMFYPIMVLSVAVIIVAIMLIFVIPEFEKLFSSFGAGLPTLTQSMIDVSHWFQEWWYIFFFGVIVFAMITRATYKRSPRMQHLLDRMVLRAPIFGPVLRKAVIARYARTLATMFGAGVPLVEGLAAVAGATGNRVYYDACYRIRREVSTGRPLETSMAQTRLFPPMVLQMVATGEETGELESMLHKTADYFESEVNDAVDAMSSLIEPIMIVILGGIVGTIVVAMYLPIFKMAEAF